MHCLFLYNIIYSVQCQRKGTLQTSSPNNTKHLTSLQED